jgi:hypothetical protein
MNIMKRIAALFFVLTFLFNITSFSTVYASENEKDVVDYILVLDCTSFSAVSDVEDMRIAAAKLFVDIIPVDNSRLSILTVREKITESYQLKADDLIAGEHILTRFQCVKEVLPLQEVGSIRQRQKIKEEIEEAYVAPEKFTYSDIHTGMYAAIDTLKSQDSKNACIIVISNGRAADYKGYLTKDESGNIIESTDTLFDQVEKSITDAGIMGNDWLTYFVKVNLGDSYREALDSSDRIEQIVKSAGGERLDVTDPEQLIKLFSDILAKFINREADIMEISANANGEANAEFEVMDIVSEMNIVLTGGDVKNVVLITPEGEGIELDENIGTSDSNIHYSLEYGGRNNTFKYAAIKLIRPKMGTWKINVKTDAGNKIYFQKVTAQEVVMTLDATPAPGEEVYSKSEDITLNAFLEYAGEKYTSKKFFSNNDATLIVTNETTGDVENITVKGREDGTGYTTEYKPKNSGVYNFKFRVNINSREGFKETDIVSYRFENVKPVALGRVEDVTLPIGENSSGIDLLSLFSDEDGDELFYELANLTDRNVEITYGVDEKGYLTFAAPMTAGEYEIEIQARDYDMSDEYVAQTFIVSATNQCPYEAQPFDKTQLIIHVPSIISKGDNAVEYNVADYFKDNDKFDTLSYTFSIDAEEEPAPIEVSIENTILIVNAIGKGSCVVNVSATDVNGEVATQEIQIKVSSWIADMFKKYWWALAILIVVMIIITIIVKDKKIRDGLQFTFIESGTPVHSESIESFSQTEDEALNKKKVELQDICSYINYENYCVDTRDFDTYAYILGTTIFGKAPTIVKPKSDRWIMNDNSGKSKMKIKKGEVISLKDGDREIKVERI